MAIPISNTMVWEHKVNPIYEAFKKAGISFTSEFTYDASSFGVQSESTGRIDVTEKVAQELEAAGFCVIANEQDSSPDPSQAVSSQRYVYPDCYMGYVADTLNIAARHSLERMGITGITLKRDGETIIVDVTKD